MSEQQVAVPHENLLNADEPRVIEHCMDLLAQELQQYPEFADFLDDIDYHVCPRGDLVEAIRRAPSNALRLILWGIYGHREALAMVTGRSFF